MTSVPTFTTATDKIVDAVASQAADIAKDVAMPAAKIAAAHFVRTRVKGIVALLLVASAMAMFVKRQKSASSTAAEDKA